MYLGSPSFVTLDWDVCCGGRPRDRKIEHFFWCDDRRCVSHHLPKIRGDWNFRSWINFNAYFQRLEYFEFFGVTYDIWRMASVCRSFVVDALLDVMLPCMLCPQLHQTLDQKEQHSSGSYYTGNKNRNQRKRDDVVVGGIVISSQEKETKKYVPSVARTLVDIVDVPHLERSWALCRVPCDTTTTTPPTMETIPWKKKCDRSYLNTVIITIATATATISKA